jgi:hypothetical protein
MKLGNFDDAAHTLTNLLISVFKEAEQQLHVTKWQFAQSVLERFIQLLSLLEEGECIYDATDSWVVCLFQMPLLISASISLVEKYYPSSRIRLSKS